MTTDQPADTTALNQLAAAVDTDDVPAVLTLLIDQTGGEGLFGPADPFTLALAGLFQATLAAWPPAGGCGRLR